MMTARDIFVKVADHLRKQNAKALDEFGSCVYRARDGKMCAIGCLIPYDSYSVEFEGGSWDEPEILSVVIKTTGDLSYMKFEMLSDLREMHDNKPVEEWPATLARIEEAYAHVH